MESPVRKLQKRNDYNRHKLLRKIKRRRKAAAEQQAHAAEKDLKKKLRVTPPKFEGGKNAKDIDITYVDNPTYNEELGLFKDDNGMVVGDSIVLPELEVTPQLSRANEFRDQRKRFHYEQPLETVSPEFELLSMSPLLNGVRKYVGNKIRDGLISTAEKYNPTIGRWSYRVPYNKNMAYRIMEPEEVKWLQEGNELAVKSANKKAVALDEARREVARGRSGRKISLFKSGAEHGGRKQFAKGQPWNGTTVTNGEKHYLAIPGENLNWVSGRHFRGPQGSGFRVGSVDFADAPFGSHIDLLTNETGLTGVNPSLMPGSAIYKPYNLFGNNFGYIKMHLTK